MRSSNQRWKGLLKFIGPIFFIFLIIRVVDPVTATQLIREIKPEAAVLSLFLAPIIVAALTARWWLICRRLEMKTPFIELFQIFYLSRFFSLLPVVIVSPLSKFIYLKEKESAATTAISITMDKVFDIIGLIFFGIFGLLYFPGILFKDNSIWIFLAIMILLVFSILVFRRKLWSAIKAKLDRYLSKNFRKIGKHLETDFAGFWSHFNLKLFMLMLAISILIGILRSLVLFLLALSLNIHIHFGFIVACRSLIGIANIIPITINGLGTRDAILLITLPLAGVSKEAAIALSFISFLWIICFKFMGIVFWLKRPIPPGIFTRKIVDTNSKANFEK